MPRRRCVDNIESEGRDLRQQITRTVQTTDRYGWSGIVFATLGSRVRQDHKCVSFIIQVQGFQGPIKYKKINALYMTKVNPPKDRLLLSK